MSLTLTAVFQNVPGGYIAFVEELPGANTQGRSLEEARDNLREAVQLVLEANRALTVEALGDEPVIRETSWRDPTTRRELHRVRSISPGQLDIPARTSYADPSVVSPPSPPGRGRAD
jgi:predicted RNase H-like HicB family nuclease